MPGPDRTATVTLRANVAGYVANIGKAAAATKAFGAETVKSANTHKSALDKVGKASLLLGSLVGVGVGLAVKTYADFEKQLSNVRAVSGATAGQMNLLSQAAIDAGRATVFSATDAAKAEAELAKVGISVSDILGGALTGSLNLASAGNIDLADAAQLAGQAMKIFNLSGADVPHIADELASGANKSAASVEDLGAALRQGGLVAAQTGLTLDDTVGTLAAFADNALIGSDAGTSFKTMLQRLTPQSDQAAALMKQLGINAFDAGGQFIGITSLAGKLRAALKDMSQEQRNAALQTIFGSDAVRAATVLYNVGADGLRKYIDATNDQGAAARVAAINLDNLSGDVEQLKGSLETALIGSASGANSALRDLTQTATAAVNAFSELPKPVQEGALALAAFAAAALLAGGAMLTFAPKIKPGIAAMGELGITGKRVVSFLTGPWGAAFALGALAIGIFVKQQIDAKRKAEDLRASLDQQTGAITANTKQLVAQTLQGQDVFQRYGHLVGGNLEIITNAALGQQDALAQLRGAQSSVADEMGVLVARHGDLSTAEFQRLTDLQAMNEAYGGLFKVIGQTSDVLNPQITQQKELSSATGGAAQSADEFAKAQVDQAQATSAAADALTSYTDAAKNSGLITLSLRDASRSFQQALADANAAAKDNGHTLDIHTQKGRDNAAALDKVAQAARDQATAIFNSTQKTKGDAPAQAAMRASLEQSRGALIATGIRFGLTKKQAAAYADSVLAIPPAVTTTVHLNGAEQARADAEALRVALSKIKDKSVTLTVRVNTANKLSANPGLSAAANNAEGGLQRGPGTGTSDSILSWLSTGEYVVKAAAVSKYGAAFFDRLNAMRFAEGGVVAPRPAAAAGPQQQASRQVIFQGPLGTDEDRVVAKVVRALRNDDALHPVSWGR